MRIIKNTLLAFAVSMTAIFNLASAQNQEVLFNTTSCGQETIEITYTSDVPKYIFFEIIEKIFLVLAHTDEYPMFQIKMALVPQLMMYLL